MFTEFESDPDTSTESYNQIFRPNEERILAKIKQKPIVRIVGDTIHGIADECKDQQPPQHIISFVDKKSDFLQHVRLASDR